MGAVEVDEALLVVTVATGAGGAVAAMKIACCWYRIGRGAVVARNALDVLANNIMRSVAATRAAAVVD